MDPFYEHIKALPEDQKIARLDQIIGFLRQHNANDQANAFQELKNCYPKFPLSPKERVFREYLAWSEISKHQDHRILQHIFSSAH
jgi:hypothetical protein